VVVSWPVCFPAAVPRSTGTPGVGSFGARIGTTRRIARSSDRPRHRRQGFMTVAVRASSRPPRPPREINGTASQAAVSGPSRRGGGPSARVRRVVVVMPSSSASPASWAGSRPAPGAVDERADRHIADPLAEARGQAEVDHPHLSDRRDHDVLGLDVPVHQAGPVRHGSASATSAPTRATHASAMRFGPDASPDTGRPRSPQRGRGHEVTFGRPSPILRTPGMTGDRGRRTNGDVGRGEPAPR
jgi:hypothetical protein